MVCMTSDNEGGNKVNESHHHAVYNAMKHCIPMYVLVSFWDEAK